MSENSGSLIIMMSNLFRCESALIYSTVCCAYHAKNRDYPNGASQRSMPTAPDFRRQAKSIMHDTYKSCVNAIIRELLPSATAASAVEVDASAIIAIAGIGKWLEGFGAFPSYTRADFRFLIECVVPSEPTWR